MYIERKEMYDYMERIPPHKMSPLTPSLFNEQLAVPNSYNTN